MKDINKYFESLAVKHLGHSELDCHFSDASVFANRVPRVMNYPCMGIDVEGFGISGQNGNEQITVQYIMYILSHVRDTSNFVELQKVFNSTYHTALSILKDIRKDDTAPACYFDFLGTEGTRIEFKDAALYGYALAMTIHLPFDFVTCKL